MNFIFQRVVHQLSFVGGGWVWVIIIIELKCRRIEPGSPVLFIRDPIGNMSVQQEGNTVKDIVAKYKIMSCSGKRMHQLELDINNEISRITNYRQKKYGITAIFRDQIQVDQDERNRLKELEKMLERKENGYKMKNKKQAILEIAKGIKERNSKEKHHKKKESEKFTVKIKDILENKSVLSKRDLL